MDNDLLVDDLLLDKDDDGFIEEEEEEIDLDAIDESLILEDERIYLNNYHKQVYDKISPYLNEEEKHWLKTYTREI